MDDKEYIETQKQIDKELIVVNPKEELARSFDKAFISESNEDSCDDSVVNMIKSLQQHSGGRLAEAVNSLQDHLASPTSFDSSFGLSPGSHDKSDCPTTVAKLLGEVVSDFLTGLSKNEENSTVREVRNAVSKITSHLDLSILERLENDANLKQVLGMLAEKVESTDQEH